MEMISKRPKRSLKLKRLGPKVRIPSEMYEELIRVHGVTAYPGTLMDFALHLLKLSLEATQRAIEVEAQKTRLIQPASPQLAAKLREKR